MGLGPAALPLQGGWQGPRRLHSGSWPSPRLPFCAVSGQPWVRSKARGRAAKYPASRRMVPSTGQGLHPAVGWALAEGGQLRAPRHSRVPPVSAPRSGPPSPASPPQPPPQVRAHTHSLLLRAADPTRSCAEAPASLGRPWSGPEGQGTLARFEQGPGPQRQLVNPGRQPSLQGGGTSRPLALGRHQLGAPGGGQAGWGHSRCAGVEV